MYCGKCKIILNFENSDYNIFAYDDWKFCLACEIYFPYERKEMHHKYIPFCEPCQQIYKPEWISSSWAFTGVTYFHHLKILINDMTNLCCSIYCNNCARNDFHTIRRHLYNSKTQSRGINCFLNEEWQMETTNYDNLIQSDCVLNSVKY